MTGPDALPGDDVTAEDVERVLRWLAKAQGHVDTLARPGVADMPLLGARISALLGEVA